MTLNQIGRETEPPAGVDASAGVDYDARLMLEVRGGSTACFALLLERHRNPVIHFLFRMVQNQAVAEELAQEAFLRVYRSRESYEPSAKFTTWLFRIATHLALNWLRDNRRERGQESLDQELAEGMVRQVPDRVPNVEQSMVADARLDEVRRAIQLLPEKQRAAVIMHKYQELDYTQIALVLGCSEAALKSLLFRAYETLRARLAHLNRAAVRTEA
ncbi:MAG: sigma-70 family RNA polymerase sigma factor [Bryobacteraceae bacterium]